MPTACEPTGRQGTPESKHMPDRCPNCNASNRPDARFCLECGEPLDPQQAAIGEVPAGRAPDRPRWWDERRGLLGALLSVLLVVAIGYSTWQGGRDRQSAAYERGLTEQAAHHWPEAVAAFRIAGAYADAPRHLADTTLTWTRLQQWRADADAAEAQGAWWDAAAAWRRIVDLDSLYKDGAARLAAAQARLGVLIYRVPHGPQMGIWWAQADGSRPHRFPGGTELAIHGISPDGHWAIYTDYLFYPWPPGRHTLNIIDLQTGQIRAVPLRPMVAPDDQSVRFRNDSSGFWWVVGSRWSYYSFATGVLQPITGTVLAADPQNGRLLLTAEPPGAGGAPAPALLANATGGAARRLVPLLSNLAQARFSPDGRWLLCRGYNSDTGAPAEHILAFQFAAADSDGDDDAPPTLIADLPTGATDGTPGPPFTGAFLPLGAQGETRVLVTWPGSPLMVIAAPPGQGAPAGQQAVVDFRLGTGLRLRELHTDLDDQFQAVHLALPGGGMVDWLGFSAGRRSVFYLADSPGGQLGLYSAPAGTPGGVSGLPPDAALLLARDPNLDAWMHNTGLSHDGGRVLAILDQGGLPGPPAGAPHPAGLWALRPDGGDPVLVVPDATEFWTPEGWLVRP